MTPSLEIQGRIACLELGAGRLTEAQLVDVASAVAADPALWYGHVDRTRPTTRQRVRLYEADNLEVVLLLWSPAEPADWHDHGGSSGGFAVVLGELRERYRAADGGAVVTRVLEAGWHGGYGAAHVHEVAPSVLEPTVSIHAYSPRLTTLTYYDRTPLGFVAREVLAEDEPVRPLTTV